MSNKQFTTDLIIRAQDDHVTRIAEKVKKLGDDIQRVNDTPIQPGAGAGGGRKFIHTPLGPMRAATDREDEEDTALGAAYRKWRGRAESTLGKVPTGESALLVGGLGALGAKVGMGALAAGLAMDFIQTSQKAIQAEQARAVSRGLAGKSGAGMGIGGGEFGYSYDEAERFFQQAARTGLQNQDEIAALSKLNMVAERLGIGAQAMSDFASIYAPGRGGKGDFEAGAGSAIALAMEQGLTNARVPEYLHRLSTLAAAGASLGYDVDPLRANMMVGQIATIGGASATPGAFTGDRALGIFERIDQVAQAVAGGGGTPLQQQIMLQAAGEGDLLTRRMRLRRKEYNLLEALRPFTKMGDKRAAAILMADPSVLGIGEEQALALAQAMAFAIPDFEDYEQLGLDSLGGLFAGAKKATGGVLQSVAGIGRKDIDIGMGGMNSYLSIQKSMQQARHAATRSVIQPAAAGVAKALNFIGDLLGGDEGGVQKGLWERIKGDAMKDLQKEMEKAKKKKAKEEKGAILRIEFGPKARELLQVRTVPA